MGATAPHPSSNGGATAPGFYQNAMQNAKQKVADVGQTQQAQAQPGQPPNRPGNDNALDAYNNYMSKYSQQGGNPPQQNTSGGQSQQPPNYSAMFGGDGSSQQQQPPMAAQPPQTTLRPQPPQGNAPQGPVNPQQDPRRRQPGQRPPQGISMGPGYANRPFG